MKTIWIVMPHYPDHSGGRGLVDNCVLLNGTELFSPDDIAGEFPLNETPTAKLILTLEEFDADCFLWNCLWLVSEKMRRAMALAPSDVQYFNVDASESAPLPRSKHYQIMHVPVSEYMSDQKTLVYRPSEKPVHSIESIMSYKKIVSHRDAEPTHEIFYDRFCDLLYCTDEFAVRILQTGCSGINFFDPFDFFGNRPMRFRTLRGIEETRWDPASNEMRSFLIQGLH